MSLAVIWFGAALAAEANTPLSLEWRNLAVTLLFLPLWAVALALVLIGAAGAVGLIWIVAYGL